MMNLGAFLFQKSMVRPEQPRNVLNARRTKFIGALPPAPVSGLPGTDEPVPSDPDPTGPIDAPST